MNARRFVQGTLMLTLLIVVIAGTVGCREEGQNLSEGSPASEPTRVTVAQVREWMDEGLPLVILDSRSEGAWRSATTVARGALRVPPNDVASHLSEIPRGRTVVAYCT